MNTVGVTRVKPIVRKKIGKSSGEIGGGDTEDAFRKPQQKRGQERVDAILDAAASLVIEEGMAGLNMKAIAMRANTSFGSLYHFFPDLDSVIAGLSERFMLEYRKIKERVFSISRAELARMSSAEIVDAIIFPFMAYLEANPHFAILRSAPKEGMHFLTQEQKEETAVFPLLEKVLSVRKARLSRESSRARAMVVVGAMEGIASLLGRYPGHHDAVLREFKRDLTAYLDSTAPKH